MGKKEIYGKNYRWYVETDDSYTNKVVASRLADKNEMIVGINLSIKDDKGELRDVWEVPDYPFIAELYASQADLNLNFKVYSRKLSYGPIRRWLFGKGNKPDPVVKEIEQKIKKLIKKKKAESLGKK